MCLSLNIFKIVFSDKHILKYGASNRKNIGIIGEMIALEYIIKNGWQNIIKNYRRKSDEIDIIALALIKP